MSRLYKLRRWYYRHLDFGDPQRYVHGPFQPADQCGRPGCWCADEDRSTSSRAGRVPAWSVAVSESSDPDWVYVLDASQPDPMTPGGLRTRTMHRLTPVLVVGTDGFGNPAVGPAKSERNGST